MTNTYTTTKLSATRVAVYQNGEYVCQLRPAEVKGWIARAIRSDENDREAAIMQRAYRIEAAQAYLAKRAARLSNIEVQYYLFA